MTSFGCRSLAVLIFVFAFYSDAVSSQSSDRHRSSRSGTIKNIPVGADIKRDINFNCPEEFGYYAHPTDCTQYYVCVFGGALLESCTGGLMYSHELQTCDWPRNVGCDAYNTEASDTETFRESVPSHQTEVPRGRFTVTPSSAPPLPPHRSNPQPNPVITSRGQPRQFNNVDIIKQQQLYSDIEEPASEIESDRQQRVYRGQPTLGPPRDRDGYGPPAAARSVNANVIPAYTSNGNSGKIGAFSFGTQISQPRTPTPVQEPRLYKATNDEKTDNNDSDIQINNIEDKQTEGQTHFLTLIRGKREVSSEEMVTGDETAVDRYDLNETDRDKRQARNGRLQLSPGFISNKSYKHRATPKPVQSNEHIFITQPPPTRLQAQSQNSFQPYNQNNDNYHQQLPHAQYTSTPSYNLQNYQDSGQTQQPFKASTRDPFFDNSYSFYPVQSLNEDTPTSIITKSPPISALTNSALSGGFYNNNSPAFSFNHERPQNSNSFYNSDQNSPFTHSSNKQVLGSHKLLDSTELSTTVVTQKPLTVKPMVRLRYRIKPEPRPKTTKMEPTVPVEQTTKTTVSVGNRNRSEQKDIVESKPSEDSRDKDYDEEVEYEDGEGEEAKDYEEEDEEPSDDSDKEEEDDPNFKKIDLPEAPTYDYSHLQKKYENIVNPFADPNFDFDSFIAKIRDSHLSLSEPTTPNYKSSTYTPPPYVEVPASSPRSNGGKAKQQRNLQLNYKGMSTPRPFSVPTRTIVSWPAKGKNNKNANTEQRENVHSQTNKPVHEVPDEYDQQTPKYVLQSVQNIDSIRNNRYSQPQIVHHYQQQANSERHKDEYTIIPDSYPEDEKINKPLTHIKNTNFRHVEILPKKVHHLYGGQSPQAGLNSKPYITVTTKPHTLYQTVKPQTISVNIKPQHSNGGKPQFVVTGKPHLLITGKPHISVTAKPHLQISHLPLILSTPNPQIYTLDSYQKPLGYVTLPPVISTSATPSFLNYPTVRNTTPVSIVTSTQRYNPTTTALREQPKGRRPIPKPSPEMNDYYYDEYDDDYYYEPPVKSKFMPSSEVRPQRPPIAQNDEEYDDYASYEESYEENKDNDSEPVKYVKGPQNSRPIEHNIKVHAQVQDQIIPGKYVERLPSTGIPLVAHNLQNEKSQYNLVTPKPTTYDLLADKRPKIPVPVIINNHENTNHYIMKRPEVSDYEVTHYESNASLQKSPKHNNYHESGPNTSKPPKYLNQTTLRPYTVRHRLAKTPAGYSNRNPAHAMNESKTIRGEYKWMKPDPTKRPTTKDSHNQESRTTGTKLDETSANSLDPTEPSYIQQSRQPVNSGRALYNGSQNYNPDQYDQYYPLYDEDGELYRDSDYVQQYNSASQRPGVGVQQTYHSTPLPPLPPPPAHRRPTPPAPPVVYTSAPAPAISAEDYDDAFVQGQLNNENQYQQPIRQSTRGEGNELGYEQATRFTSVFATTASATTTTTTPSTTTRTTTPPTTTTTTQRPTTAPTTEAMIPTRKSQRSTTDESLTRSLNAPSTETSTVVTITLSPISIQNPLNISILAAPFKKNEPALSARAQITPNQSQILPAPARIPPAQSSRLTENATNDRRFVSLTTGFSLRRDPNSNSENPYTLKIIKRPTLTLPHSKEVNNLQTISLSEKEETKEEKDESDIKDFSYESKEIDYKDFVTVRSANRNKGKGEIGDTSNQNPLQNFDNNDENIQFVKTDHNNSPTYNKDNNFSQEFVPQNKSTTTRFEENNNHSEINSSEYSEKHPRLFLKTVIKRPLSGHNNLQSDDSHESDSILTFLKQPFFGYSKRTTPHSMNNAERRSDGIIDTTDSSRPYRKDLTNIYNPHRTDNEYSGVPNVSPYTSLENLRRINTDRKSFQNDLKMNKGLNTTYDIRNKENFNDKQVTNKRAFQTFVPKSSRFGVESEFYPATTDIPINSTPRIVKEKSSNPIIEALSKYFKILPIRFESPSSSTTQKAENVQIDTFTVTQKSVEIINLNDENKHENRDVINIGFHKKQYEPATVNVPRKGPRIEIKSEHSDDYPKSINNYDGLKIPSLQEYVNTKSNRNRFLNQPGILTSTLSPSTHKPVTVFYEKPNQYIEPGNIGKSDYVVSHSLSNPRVEEFSENISTENFRKLLPDNVVMERYSESTTHKFNEFDKRNSFEKSQESRRHLESTSLKYEDIEEPRIFRATPRTGRHQESSSTKYQSFEEPKSPTIFPMNNRRIGTATVQYENFEEPNRFRISSETKRRAESTSQKSINYEEYVEPNSFSLTTLKSAPIEEMNNLQSSSESNKISTEETSTTLIMTTTTPTTQPTTPSMNNTSIPIRVSRINPAIKLAAAYPGAARRSYQSSSKCATDNSLQQNPKCNEIVPPRTSSRGRGTAHYSTSGGDPPSHNRGTPPSRGRPTLKPSTSIVSKALEFVDIYRYPASRPAAVYPQPTPDKTAAKCRRDVCLLPDCSCGGKDIPGDIPVENVPQLVLLTFDDSVNDLNKVLYADLFEKGRVNPNGCPISATFYVSHEWTDYSQVQNLYAAGHEMASHTISHSFGEQFSQKKWNREVGGQREILAAYGGVKLEDVRGMRAPFLSVGGNKMFKMLYDSNFTYDSSMPVYENRPPSWPYTLDYKLFHDCMIPPCPTRSYPGLWEVPMVMWQDLNGGRCSMGDACSNPPTAEGVLKMLLKNFDRHYTTNRAPFGLFYHAAWFTQPHHKEGFIMFLDTINRMQDVFLVTNWQALQWVRDPTPLDRMNSFQPFQCDYPDRPKRCNNPKVCNLWHKSGVRYMRTCQPCPDIYPWTGKTGIRSSKIDNEVED